MDYKEAESRIVAALERMKPSDQVTLYLVALSLDQPSLPVLRPSEQSRRDHQGLDA
jgi:hypothetical protein